MNQHQHAIEQRLRTGRPHWWAVLSVGIALMALTTAVSEHHDLHNQGHLGARTAHSQRAPHEVVTRTSIHTVDPPIRPTKFATGLPTVTTLSIDSGAHATSGGPTDNLDAQSPTSPTSVVAASPVASSFEGFFESPWVVSTIYPISSDEGHLTVTANWSQTVAMTLTLSCPPWSQSKTGGPGISLDLSGFDTQCVISLSEPVGTPGVVDYTVAMTT